MRKFTHSRSLPALLVEKPRDRRLDQLFDGLSGRLGRLEEPVELAVLQRDVDAFHRLEILRGHAPDRSGLESGRSTTQLRCEQT
jgi:hypothetical protein